METERSSFSPSDIMPGIGFSPDRMLQASMSSYADAHCCRVGAQCGSLPANAPESVNNTCRADGPMRFNATSSTKPEHFRPIDPAYAEGMALWRPHQTAGQLRHWVGVAEADPCRG